MIEHDRASQSPHPSSVATQCLCARGECLPGRNLSAALFRLEASRGSDEALAIVRALVDWLADPAQTGLRRAFAVWFGRVFLPKRLPGLSFPPLCADGEAWLVQVRAVSRS